MPPKPYGQDALPEGRAASGRTFHDAHDGDQQRKPRAGAAPPRRWSFMLEDLPALARRALNDVNKGYVARLALATGAGAAGAYGAYLLLARSQENLPLARRWSLFSRPVPIVLLEKDREEGSDMFIYRFALPHSYDYAGYEPVSSVQVSTTDARGLSGLTRWYTPISHPQARGFISFAIKECDPGRMSSRLRMLEPGDQLYLGRWMKEFSYKEHLARGARDLGLVCTTAGASVALQLMQVIDQDRQDPTRLRVLYCHHTAKGIPFKKDYFDRLQQRNEGRIAVAYDVLSLAKQTAADGFDLGVNTFLGNLDPDAIATAMPPPAVLVPAEGGERVARRPYVLVCGPQSMLSYLCGRVSPLGNWTYWQGWPYRYTGMLRDLGYERQQVYKFGVSTHFLAMR
ncbi:cytochrome-b5 reductase [Strigomonas culicis]|uniref:Cytochrome-b5 reductase n=1 Tax=Strigomonas culicis TaxID=28005 RepID=S9UIC2_9TRYP|nr:cytochrome-b5 reductase [Strigomonas culicis]|eukprot:EPY28489.1 cytochrome-b5 reductase [Strigomonas culicis]